MDNEVLRVAIDAPKLFIDASLGEGEEYKRDPGFQLTKEQILSLRKYEAFGLSLPVVIDDIIVYLDYGKGDAGSPGLTAQDFQGTFKLVYEHANRWAPLCEKIKLTGTDLKIFAGSILRIGAGITELYDDQKASKYLDEHGIETVQEYLSQKVKNPELPSLNVSADHVEALNVFFDDMLHKVDTAHAKASYVKEQIEGFAADLHSKIVREVQLRLKAVTNNTYQEDIKKLQKTIDERSDEIDAVSKQYDKLVKDAITAAASLNIAGLALGIYTGVKAEELRKQRNQLKAAQEKDNLLMASKNKTLSSLNRIRGDLQELENITLEADVATQNLMFVWSSLTRFINASKEDADSDINALSLRQFKIQVQNITEPWEDVKNGANQLLKVFVEAEEEYQKIAKGDRKMLRSFAASDGPGFDVDKLRAMSARAQDANVTSQMLFERWKYQEARVEQINQLALAMARVTLTLRDISATLKFDLQRAQKKLRSYQLEIESPGYSDEVHDDVKAVLERLSEKLTEQFDLLKEANKDLSVPYSRVNSAQLANTLLGEKTYAEQRNKELDVQREKLKEQIRSLSDGIDVVAKAGIEKIDQQVELTKDKVVELGVAPPQVTVVMLAIDTLKNLIADAAEIVSYLNLVAELGRQKDKLAGLTDQFERNVQDIQRADGQVELLKALDDVDEERLGYVKEFSILLAYVESLTSKYGMNGAQPMADRIQSVIAQIDEDVMYLSL